MYTKSKYSLRDLIRWTRYETIVFVVIALVPVILYEVFDQKWLHFPWLPIAIVGTAVAFIISFQNNASYDRLWEARKVWGGIVNTSRSWGLVVNDYITNDFTDRPASESELHEIRRGLVLRHIAWLTALRHALRQARPWEGFLKHKTNREWAQVIGVREHLVSVEDEIAGYLSDGECVYLAAKSNKAAHLISLQSKAMRTLRTRGLIDDFRHMEMQNLLGRLLELQGQSERIKNFPYPRQYATLNAAFLWIFVLLLPLGIMFEFDKIGADLRTSHPVMGDLFIWLSMPFSVLLMWIFHTMERIGRLSENPFEGSANDVPITTMARAIEIDLRQMIDEDPASIPSPVEPVYDTQM